LKISTFSEALRRLSGFPQSKYSAPRSYSRQNSTSNINLERNVEEETPVGTDFLNLEYAVEQKILETPLLDLSYYADVVGDVPPQREQVRLEAPEPFNFGNGDLPPEWGLDIIVRGGFIRYGPWADRQRWVVLHASLICHVSDVACLERHCNRHSSRLPIIMWSHLQSSDLETKGCGCV
jgi:hypothetical protein